MANNAILVFAEKGEIKHLTCTEAHARSILHDIAHRGESASAFFSDEHIDQEMMLAVSEQLREKVAQAKTKLRKDIKIKAALDKFQVPPDIGLRAKINQAWHELGVAA